MYYEETVIDGVLHWRSTPNGQWIQKTPQQLTELLLSERYKTEKNDSKHLFEFPVYPGSAK